MGLSIDGTIHAGDVLTSVTVALSVVTLILSQAKDRRADRAALAKEARLAGARVIAQIDRAARLMLSLYTGLTPGFIDLSRALAQDFDVAAARDAFWRDVNQAAAKLTQTLLDERIGTAYVDLVAYLPEIRHLYVEAYAALQKSFDDTLDAFLVDTSQALFDLEKDGYTAAAGGNLLRGQAWKKSSRLTGQLEAIVAPLRERLFTFIEQDDESIARASEARRD